ncbi:DUF1499 domain-containing protein [uncultured Roseobacter sp.]|uniref:DUF1499 domain-containing protein n=1 Tax=uncultured Roseobacter sp. TaxID=114847 RepID=UPI00262E1842|nr:DUF1499 domain-containing protein [uncultured Roseobacter sp.]
MRIILGGVLCLLLAVMVAVRLAPDDPARWHQPVASDSDQDMPGGAIRVIPAEPDALAQADVYLQTLPRTTRLAGSAEEGMVTYVTRSRVFGFPDYTTLQYNNGTLRAYARLRFGVSDLGVNRGRLEQLLAAIQ